MEAFTKDEVCKDMKISAPAEMLKVKYGSIEVTPGKVVTPTQAKDRPVLSWNAEPGAFYTMIMNDPDAPSRKDTSWSEWHHWMVGNIPGCQVEQGEILADYISPGPPEGSGPHRYVFLIFKQKGKLDFSGEPHLTSKSGDGRVNHSAKAFQDKHKLEGPLAGNYIVAEWDDYVPILYKQLGL